MQKLEVKPCEKTVGKIEKQVETPVVKTVEKPIQTPIAKLVEKPINRPAEQLDEPVIHKQLDKTSEEMAQKWDERPVERWIERSDKKSADRPVQKVNEKPVEEIKVSGVSQLLTESTFEPEQVVMSGQMSVQASHSIDQVSADVTPDSTPKFAPISNEYARGKCKFYKDEVNFGEHMCLRKKGSPRRCHLARKKDLSYKT